VHGWRSCHRNGELFEHIADRATDLEAIKARSHGILGAIANRLNDGNDFISLEWARYYIETLWTQDLHGLSGRWRWGRPEAPGNSGQRCVQRAIAAVKFCRRPHALRR
jgi:hypothetical protein